MTLVQLLDKASEGYDVEGTLAMYYHPQTGELKRGRTMAKFGDGLARFVVVELAETFDPDASKTEQVAEAVRVMENAKREIEGVLNSLERM
jgi:hypothetical protein